MCQSCISSNIIKETFLCLKDSDESIALLERCFLLLSLNDFLEFGAPALVLGRWKNLHYSLIDSSYDIIYININGTRSFKILL